MTSSQIDRITGLGGDVALKAPVRVAAIANITLTGLQTILGIVLAEGDRVLLTAQTNTVNNGIWLSSAGAWTRALDFNGPRDVVQGTTVPVYAAGKLSEWQVTSANPITVDTTAITLVQIKILRGQATFATAATVAVAFAAAEPDANYYVAIGGNANQTFWVSAKTTAGFTLNSSNGASVAVVDWIMSR